LSPERKNKEVSHRTKERQTPDRPPRRRDSPHPKTRPWKPFVKRVKSRPL